MRPSKNLLLPAVILAAACSVIAALPVPAAADWAQFRGTQNNSVAGEKELPLEWTEHIAWKAELPGRGPSSPIVVGERVFVTASSGVKQDRLHVLCFDVPTGEKLWERRLWATGRTFTHPTSANAAPTPASDGKRVFAFYSSNDLACFDLEGNLQWFRGLAHDYPKAGNDIGMSSSPVVVDNTVVVQIENQGDSFAAGIDTATGETRWRINRERRANWASPTVIPGKKPQGNVVLLQSPAGVTAHDPRSGNELPWEHDESCSGIPSTVVVQGVAYVPSGGITAIKAASASTAAEILWRQNRLKPSAASPVVYKNRVYTVNSAGVLTCGDAQSGDVLWQLRLKGRFWATPIAAGNHLHLVNSDGLVQVVRPGEKGEIVARAEMGESIQGTPAAADGAIYVRSDKHLWKIAK